MFEREIKGEVMPLGFYAVADYFGEFDIYHWDGKKVEYCVDSGEDWELSSYPNIDMLLDQHLSFRLECWHLGE